MLISKYIVADGFQEGGFRANWIACFCLLSIRILQFSLNLAVVAVNNFCELQIPLYSTHKV